ncbi:MAG TPA: hypothetical protein PKE40_14675 [Arachnia sp.]|nr:hypothetical protein [Arachnia sp.]HMT87588.1 hypothetical protein [Arachnia sp.]
MNRAFAHSLRARLLASLTLVLLVGCSPEQPTNGIEGLQRLTDASSPASAPAVSGAPGAQDDTVGIADPLPLQHYMLVGREYDAVMQAIAVLAGQCMTAQGFDLEVPAPPPAKGVLVDISFRRYGAPETLDDAHEVGYGVPTRVGASSAEDAVGDAFEAQLSDAARAAYLGAPGEMSQAWAEKRRAGCLGEADRRLMGESAMIEASGLAQPKIVQDLNIDPRATDSPESRAATERFTSCMAEAGYPGLEGPLDEPEQFAGEDPQQPSEAAIQAAVIQFGCAEESGVRVAMRETEVAFQTQAIEANPEAFAQIRQELDDVVRRATEVVAEAPGR